MEAINLSQVSQTNFTNKQEIQKEAPKAPEQKKNGKKLLAAGAVMTAIIAVASLAITGKHEKAKKVINESLDIVQKPSISELTFDSKGLAKKGDELFTGVAEHTNKKGDKFLLEYRDGVLKKSMKNINPETGAVSLKKGNFIKHYSEVNGTRKVSISKDIINDVQRSNCEISKGSVIRTKITGGKETFYFNDGKLRQCTLSDGTIREWYDNGQMSREYLPDRTLRLWYDNGQMERENLPDGTLRLWDNNGQIVSECKKIMLEDHIKPVEFKITYDESGQIKSLGNKTDDRIIVYHYDEGYSCIASGYNKESLKEIFDKLSIEMPDIKFD